MTDACLCIQDSTLTHTAGLQMKTATVEAVLSSVEDISRKKDLEEDNRVEEGPSHSLQVKVAV